MTKRLIIYSTLLGMIAGGFFVWLSHPVRLFLVENKSIGQVLFCRRIDRPGFTFATVIRHSVQKTPVFEYYRLENDGNLLLTGTSLQDLGWGMPSTVNSTIEFKNNFMIIDGINRLLKALPFRVSYIAEPHLIIQGAPIDLRKYVDDSDLIAVYSLLKPYIAYLLRGETNVFQAQS
ncbi:MAG: DUF1850 domain-containing protein [Deltaproteobacteria bacterium]|nr:DUF1850 domain-containing protein [Deltaproteobacteria bacterium]